ncbi:hypothetical protein [Flavihumibacter sp. ZG627]|uniref:hypothetical protein n=1 Tax=Flavihumibacter sp. ZG627 TaxID=1463156 RepID=UPI0005800938|nr:hypothetical protein [Flavihumibacter sp. ZG627]KIC92117.1 hypothetical protein HY58_00695 [Flavihumibacter sp. ZG627]
MKKLLLLAVLLPAFSVVSASSGDPSNNKEKKQFKKQKLARAIPAYVPAEGYWVIKSTLDQPEKSIIFFYNNDNQLVGEENISSKDARLNNRKLKMQLKSSLALSINTHKQEQLAKKTGD